jgi:hypothetical protein
VSSSVRVYRGAILRCSFGTAPAQLNVVPVGRGAGDMSAANVGDTTPMANIMPFGVCMSMANPTVAAGTAAAHGVLTPMPCVPACTGWWIPGDPTERVGGLPALTLGSQIQCAHGGVVTVVSPGASRG